MVWFGLFVLIWLALSVGVEVLPVRVYSWVLVVDLVCCWGWL